MKVLFVIPEIRLDDSPNHFPFWAGILAAIAENKGAEVGILDLNALRDNFRGNLVPEKIIQEELSLAKWDIIGIGGLTTTYSRIKQLIPMIRKTNPNSLLVAGGGWSSYNPIEIFQLIPEINIIVIGEGEETFSELYDQVNSGSTDFENVKGICINKNNEYKFTEPRALIPDLNTIPYPAYDLLETDIYFKYSSMPHSVRSFNSKKRASVVWERGCPRGCTFCSHNGMSRIDLQNIYGEGDRRKGEKLVRISDKENDTFQLPARWPTPEYAVNNVKLLVEKFNVDFISILDENMTSNLKWTQEFCNLYVKEGLSETIAWGTLGDAPSVATKPSIVQTMVDAGCDYISFGFESASNKVLNEDIQKGQTQQHLDKTVETIKNTTLTPIATFMIGNPHENIDDLLETVMFWIKHNIEVDPFICTPYVGSPLFYNNKDFLLEQYDDRLKLLKDGNYKVDNNIIQKWKLQSLDKFMKECGDATQYTATVSQYFTIPELYSLKRFMYKKDLRRILQMAHQRYDQTHQNQWKHDEKWSKYCSVCAAKIELESFLETPTNY